MSSGITDTFISNGVEDIRGITIHLTTSAVILSEHAIEGRRSACQGWQPMRLPYNCEKRVQKMLNRRINSWRASIACAGFIRLRTFSRRSRSIAASSCTSRLRAFHFAYLPAPIPSASRAEAIQTVMSVEVTRSISVENRSRNVPPSQQSSTGTRGARAPTPALFGAPPKSFPKMSREARDTAGEAARAPQQFIAQPLVDL